MPAWMSDDIHSLRRGAIHVALTGMGNGRSLPGVDVGASADVGAAPAPTYAGPLLILSLAPHPGAVEALRDRWLALVDKGADDCWRWRGAKTSKGMPHVRLDPWHTVGAARVALLLLGVPLPVRARVRRTCDTADCVSPHHHVTEAFARVRRPSGRVLRPRFSATVEARIAAEAAAGVPRRVLCMRYQRPRSTIAAIIARGAKAPKEDQP